MPQRMGSKRSVPDRLFDTWIYKVKDVEFEEREYAPNEDREPFDSDDRDDEEQYPMRKQRVKNRVVEIEVRYCKQTEQSEEPPHPTREVHFEVVCDEIKLRMKGTDIELIKAAVWDRLDKKFEIKWDYFYLVEIEQNRPYRADGTGISFSYDGVWRGTTWDGKLLLKQYNGSEFKIKPWPGAFTNKAGKVVACIPATDENKAALKEFCTRMDKMREVMADFLRPEVILQTLANLSGAMPFLPLPETTEKEANAEATASTSKD